MSTKAANPPNMDLQDDERSEDGPVSSFQSLQAEGDLLAKQGDLRKAVEAFSKALQLRPTDKNCLVARAKCHLQLGDPRSALQDAEASLKDDKDFFKGKFFKAEALYAMGDFEMALVYYHRGHNLRPELDEFRLGIQKAKEAIDNSIGNPKDYKLSSPTKEHFDVNYITTNTHSSTASAAKPGSKMIKERITGQKKTAVINTPTNTQYLRSKTAVDIKNAQRDEKQLLGELYAHKEYLQKLIEDRDFVEGPNDPLYTLLNEGLRYLETRTEFWRQQKPIYARRKEQHRLRSRLKEKEKSATKEVSKLNDAPKKKPKKVENNSSAAQLENIKKMLEGNLLDSAEKEARQLIKSLDQSKANKEAPMSDLCELMGQLYLKKEQIDLAQEWFNKEIELNSSNSHVARGWNSLGAIKVKQGDFKSALEMFNRKLNLIGNTSSLDGCCLLHDIGRCQLELGNIDDAFSISYQCLDIAKGLANITWQVNANMLIGQIFGKKKDVSQEQEHYRSALNLAKENHFDAAAIQSIQGLIK